MELKQPEIVITGVNESLTTRTDGPHTAIYEIYLNLSERPPSRWDQFFEAARRFPRHTMWRKAWCNGSHIVIQCPPEELEKHHIECLKEDVQTANTNWWSAMEELQRKAEAERAEEEAEKERVSNVLGSIEF